MRIVAPKPKRTEIDEYGNNFFVLWLQKKKIWERLKKIWGGARCAYGGVGGELTNERPGNWSCYLMANERP